MKIGTIASIVVVALLIGGFAAIAFADTSSVATTATSTTGHSGTLSLSCRGLTVGETITVAGMTGTFQNLTSRSHHTSTVTSGSWTSWTPTASITWTPTAPSSSVSTVSTSASESSGRRHPSSYPPTATGSFNFQVSNIYSTGCTLSITGGTIGLGAASYGITGGSVILSRGIVSGEGLGTTSAGSFLIQILEMRGMPTSAKLGATTLDFKSGASEYLIYLHS